MSTNDYNTEVNGGYNLNSPAAFQYRIGDGANTFYSCRCTSTERWFKNNYSTVMVDTTADLLWGQDVKGAVEMMCYRLYNRKLTDEETLSNRALDIERFALEGLNTTII